MLALAIVVLEHCLRVPKKHTQSLVAAFVLRSICVCVCIPLQRCIPYISRQHRQFVYCLFMSSCYKQGSKGEEEEEEEEAGAGAAATVERGVFFAYYACLLRRRDNFLLSSFLSLSRAEMNACFKLT